jgi:hypothetical protein
MYVWIFLQPLPEGPEIVTRYEFLEDECEGILELKSETTLVYTGLVRRIVEVDGILASTTVTYMTLELVNIPIKRIMRGFEAYDQASTSGIPKD